MFSARVPRVKFLGASQSAPHSFAGYEHLQDGIPLGSSSGTSQTRDVSGHLPTHIREFLLGQNYKYSSIRGDEKCI